MLVIRLTRVGKKNSPAYRVVVAEQKKAVQRKFIEILGHYNPVSHPKQIVINKEKTLQWIKQGAQPSDTVRNLMVNLGILPKTELVKIIHGRPTKKKDAGKKGTDEKPVEAQKETEDIAEVEEQVETPSESVAEATAEERAESEPLVEETTPAEAAEDIEDEKKDTSI